MDSLRAALLGCAQRSEIIVEFALARRPLLLLIGLQILTHLFWLSPAAHSGQVAIPWMMNRGMSLFDDIWEQHAPGSSLLGAAAQRTLPLDPGSLAKLLNTLLVVALTMLIYALAKRMAGKESAGLLAAVFWAWWEPVYGNVLLYFDTLLAFCVLAALAIYCRDDDRPRLSQTIAAGLLMGAATLFKQQAWLAVAVLGLWLLATDGRRGLPLYIAAALALPLLQWILLAAQGSLDAYLFWNWSFNLGGYMEGVPLDGDFFRKLLFSNLLVAPYALIALRGSGRRPRLIIFMWLAALTLLYPRIGEIHAMGHLPFTAVMSGIVLAGALPLLRNPSTWDLPRKILAGLALGIGIGWLWTGAVSYLHIPLGPGSILGYDEFRELASDIGARAATDDSLFILPETDSTPQLHPLTGLPPPGVWVKGWRWYFEPEHVVSTLLGEWETAPPTWIIVFPNLIRSDNRGIKALLEIVDERYRQIFDSAEIYGHGSAAVYKLADASG